MLRPIYRNVAAPKVILPETASTREQTLSPGAAVIHVWTLPVDGLDEEAAAPLLAPLDEAERARGARFVTARHRVLFVAAHALVRAALSALLGEPRAAWRFVADSNGKPAAYLGARPAPLSFNLSHTEGLAGVAAIAQPGRALGFDLEPLARDVDLAVANRFFSRYETGWLDGLAQPLRRPGFLRLWTLKEAFLKATGKGLTQDLASFWFDPSPPRIHFAPELAERPDDWWFEQRVLDGGHLAALALRKLAAGRIETRWARVDPGELMAGCLPRI
jgi:4'-phosphopantetheinyl transferase